MSKEVKEVKKTSKETSRKVKEDIPIKDIPEERKKDIERANKIRNSMLSRWDGK